MADFFLHLVEWKEQQNVELMSCERVSDSSDRQKWKSEQQRQVKRVPLKTLIIFIYYI